MTRPSSCSETIELVARARSHAIWARRHLLACDGSDDHGGDLVTAKRLLVAASQALGTAAMDSALPTNVTKALVDSWAGLDAFLLAAGELDEEPSGADAQRFLTRAATYLIEALPSRDVRMPVGMVEGAGHR
ncbi:MAG: hypothetical protein E6G01_14550 [Actinobacteria bacterium]|nr:MAG: hypothetical protein E6G01_14550 [Actinomycetota bacterium]